MIHSGSRGAKVGGRQVNLARFVKMYRRLLNRGSQHPREGHEQLDRDLLVV